MVSTLLDSLLVAPDITEKFTLSTPGFVWKLDGQGPAMFGAGVRSHKQQKTLQIERHPFSLVPSILISMHFASFCSMCFLGFRGFATTPIEMRTIKTIASATKTYRQLRTSEAVPRFQRHCMAVPSFEVAYLMLVTSGSHKSQFAEIQRDVALRCKL